MKVKNQKRLINGLKGLAAAVMLTAGVFVVSSFDNNDDFLWKTDPPADCSTSQVIYTYNSSTGSGGGSVSGGGNATGGSGSISGSGSLSSVQIGPIGVLIVKKSYVGCSLSYPQGCNSVDCSATGSIIYRPF
jgi:hypothetical protein